MAQLGPRVPRLDTSSLVTDSDGKHDPAERRRREQQAAVARVLAADPDNAWAVLQLPLTEPATPSVARAAYRRLSLLLHPDKCAHPSANAAFQRLSRAYAWLAAHPHAHPPPPSPSTTAPRRASPSATRRAAPPTTSSNPFASARRSTRTRHAPVGKF